MNLADKRAADFVKHVRNVSRHANVRVTLKKQKKLFFTQNKEKLNGYFTEPEADSSGSIVVAVNRPRSKWLGCLAHEFAHMCQWFFNMKVWTDCDLGKYGDAADVIDRWAKGEEFPAKVVDKAFNAVRAIETDADHKAMLYIEEWKLPVDITTYRRESDNYDYSYMMMHNNRKWKFMRRK